MAAKVAKKNNGNKTTASKSSVGAYLNSLSDKSRQQECRTVLAMMRKITGKRATMWGSSMIGFGSYHYRYASGREGDYFITGVAPRKQALTIYIMPGFANYQSLMARLGKYKTGKSCLYLKKLEDVDLDVLARLIERSVSDMRNKYPTA